MDIKIKIAVGVNAKTIYVLSGKAVATASAHITITLECWCLQNE